MSEEQKSYEQEMREAAERQLRIDIGLCSHDPQTPIDQVMAILRNIIAAGFDEITNDLLLKTLAKQTGYSIVALRKQFIGEQKAQRTKRHGTSVFDEDPAKLLDKPNEIFFVVNDGGKIAVMRPRHDPVMERDVIERMEFADFKKMYANQRVCGTEVAKFWLTHPDRREYLEGVTFAPSGKVPDGWLNLWQGFAYKAAPGDWSRMQEHLQNVVCGNDAIHYEYLLNWAAFAVQYPERPAEVATVLRGLKGCGKGTFGKWLRRLFGQHGMQITNSAHLVGKFIQHLRDCIFLFADEAFWAGDKQHESVLKGLITEDTIPIEGKGRDVIFVPNMVHILMVSNADWVIPASSDERRYFVLDVSSAKIGDRGYFTAIEQQMQDCSGAEAMLHDLLRRDLTKFDIRNVPQTEGLRQQKKLSLGSLPSWWLAVLDRGYLYISKFDTPWFAEWHGYYSIELLYRSYQQWCDRNRRHTRNSETELGAFMKKIAEPYRPVGKHPVGEIEHPDREMLKLGGSLSEYGISYRERPSCYKCGNLFEARTAFEKANPGVIDHWLA